MTLGGEVELQLTHDQRTGIQGSPPSLAQSLSGDIDRIASRTDTAEQENFCQLIFQQILTCMLFSSIIDGEKNIEKNLQGSSLYYSPSFLSVFTDICRYLLISIAFRSGPLVESFVFPNENENTKSKVTFM